MSHWAEIDENNVVQRVLVGDNNDPAGDEGYSWLVENLGGTWIQTSYNSNFRGVFAGVGFTYNEEEDIFVLPQPFPSWTRNGSYWNPPIPCPQDDLIYQWNEEEGAWNVVS